MTDVIKIKQESPAVAREDALQRNSFCCSTDQYIWRGQNTKAGRLLDYYPDL